MAKNEEVASTDPELLRQLEAAAQSNTSLSATFTLRSPSAARVLSPAETKSAVEEIMGRARRATGDRERGVTVFANIQSFAVDAPAPFIKTILGQPEIETASANYQSEDLTIPPVHVTPSDLPRARASRAAAAPRRRRA